MTALRDIAIAATVAAVVSAGVALVVSTQLRNGDSEQVVSHATSNTSVVDAGVPHPITKVDAAAVAPTWWWCKSAGSCFRDELDCVAMGKAACEQRRIAYCVPMKAAIDIDAVCFDSLSTCKAHVPICAGVE